MRKRLSKVILTVLFCFVFVGCLQNLTMEQKVPRILKVELKSMLGQPDLVIVDVRLDEEWEKAELKIKGAVRENPERAVKSWAEKYPRDKTIVFYCD